MNLARLASGAILFSALSVVAHAAPLTFTETVTGSGSLGSAFTNQLITLSATGDTSAIVAGVNLYQLFIPTATLTVSGFAPVTLTGGVNVFSNAAINVAGFEGQSPVFDILDTVSSAFSSYGLNGPISASGTAQNSAAGTAFATSGGSFILNSTTGNATFTAATPTTPPAGVTPEPGSIALLGTGLLGLAGTMRRRLRRA